jgi:hypothetical protein
MNPVKCTRIYTDDEGESHFDQVEIELELQDFAPPAAPMHASEFQTATRYGFLSSPTGWFGDWHPAPKRQVALCLAGAIEVQVSDGESRRFEMGDIILVEDTHGKGHTTRTLETGLLAIVQLE